MCIFFYVSAMAFVDSLKLSVVVLHFDNLQLTRQYNLPE